MLTQFTNWIANVATTLVTIENFGSDYMQTTRRIRICLPCGYSAAADMRYPVLYLHDGQNLFDDKDSYSGQAWQLDRIVAELCQSGRIEPIILVAIDHAGTARLAEFAHQDRNFDGNFIKARGREYENFIIEELKPQIDRLFLSATSADETGLMGSSMGGLVSLNIALRRSDIFGKVAALSPSCWWDPAALKADLQRYQIELRKLKIWLDIGGYEGRYGDEVEEIAERIFDLNGKDKDKVRYYRDPTADHSEVAWRNRVHLPLKFLFGAGR